METLHCLRAEEVARELGIARSKAYQMMASGELPVLRIGTSVRVPVSALRIWIEQNVQGSNEGPQGNGGADRAQP
jgi:excisionase family DNA binding protein